MTFSPLTDKVMLTSKRSSRYGQRIRRVVVHHWATTTSAGLNRLVYSTDEASANYLILNDGTLIGSVPEEYRAWTSGSAEVDRPSITVEIQNETGGPEWRVSAAAIRTLTHLAADVAKRYGWSSVGPSEVEGHRQFAATACPGPYLYPRLDDIARDAEAIRSGATNVSNPGDSTGGDVTTPTVPDAPAPIDPEGFLMALSDEKQQEIYDILTGKVTDPAYPDTPVLWRGAIGRMLTILRDVAAGVKRVDEYTTTDPALGQEISYRTAIARTLHIARRLEEAEKNAAAERAALAAAIQALDACTCTPEG